MGERVGIEETVEIPDRQAVGQRIEFGIPCGLIAERIEIGHEMAPDAERINKVNDGGVFDDLDRRLGCYEGRRRFSGAHFTGA